MAQFGEEVRTRRQARQMSLADVSAATGIDRGLLSKLENGSRKPSAEQVAALADALDLSEDVLLSLAGLLPSDVRAELENVASVVTASARQAIEQATLTPRAPSQAMVALLAASVERPAPAVGGPLEGDISGTKTSNAYRAHSYHTKVPPETVRPFIRHFTRPGDVVLDPFAGSGMTGVAALAEGRHAIISDLAPAAVHIAGNYTSLCDPDALEAAITELRRQVRPTMAWLYEIRPAGGKRQCTEYVTWSDVFECPACGEAWSYWDAARDKDGRLQEEFDCLECGETVSKAQCRWVGEEPVEVNLSVDGRRKRLTRAPTEADRSLINDANEKPIPHWLPQVPFGRDREMWRAAHEAMGIRAVTDFFSKRNLHALAALRHAILGQQDRRIRDALLFAFTAIVNRASRRYQWNAKRPTNVMSGTLYVSSLRYEWNVWSLFERKARTIVKYFREFPDSDTRVECVLASATNLAHVPDCSIDFVYMDPPFGSNIFYADVSLLWESWLGELTETGNEIVVNKHLGDEKGGKSIDDYQTLMSAAFSEVRRVLKPGARAVLVFSNTNDAVWESIRCALVEARLEVEATGILDKGQRSIKGVQADLGHQQVTRVDLILTLRQSSIAGRVAPRPAALSLEQHVRAVLTDAPSGSLPTDRVFSRVVERLIGEGASVSGVSMSAVDDACRRLCRSTADGRWVLSRRADYITVESPYGCAADEYVGDAATVATPGEDGPCVTQPLTEAVPGSRNTALYNAHSYMTKVPPEAIKPFIEHYTRPGDVVLDMFAGSGMTGVAAALTGRKAILRDIAVVSAHMAYNHSRPCKPAALKRIWKTVYDRLRPTFSEIYRVPIEHRQVQVGGVSSRDGYAHYTLWSERYRCPNCGKDFTLYEAIDQASGRVGNSVTCPKCGDRLQRQRLRALSTDPVLINYESPAQRGRQQRTPTAADLEHIASFTRQGVKEWFPSVRMGNERDMYNISALHLRGISEVADFYTPRNLHALSVLLREIQRVTDDRIRQVLTFAFTNTAWHGTRMRRFNARGGQRPLTGTLYIPQISSEVNVLEVMDNKIRQLVRYYEEFPSELKQPAPVVTLGSAADLSEIPDASIDYIFTDPPFGSNIFYADCNLVTESWLGGITRVEHEAVVNRTLSRDAGGKTLGDYGALLNKALVEAKRVLKPNAWMTMVFHNTDAQVWGALQAAAESAGFELVGAGSLDRKQMSHKGYKGRSGKEKVAHFDVVMSLRKSADGATTARAPAPRTYVDDQIKRLVAAAPRAGREQWVHSELIQCLVADGYDLGSVSFAEVSAALANA